ncbi:MAG TPA: GNAT family N-acetyltransferase [Actinomycetota bacterium]|nr:GNAT family N-acetyltransferase [Actinomycetota bacterium]
MRSGIIAVYRRVFGEPPWNEHPRWARSFADRLPDELDRPGRSLILAMDADRVVGFTLARPWDREAYFCHMVEQSLPPEWTEDCFNLMELALLPEYRGRGLGGALHDALVDGFDCRTGILSSNELGPPAAARLYGKRGWRLLLKGWKSRPEADPVLVMGRVRPD